MKLMKVGFWLLLLTVGASAQALGIKVCETGASPAVCKTGIKEIYVTVGTLTIDGQKATITTGGGGGSGSGDMVGPGSATDNAAVRFDSTTGKLVQNSVVTIGDTGNMAGVGTLNTHTIPGGTDTFALLAATQTMSNKTFVAPVLGAATGTSIVLTGNYQTGATGFYKFGSLNALGYTDGTGPKFTDANTGNTITFNVQSLSTDRTVTWPNASDTVAVLATTQTFTNKTISGASNTLSNIGNSSLTNSAITINAGTNFGITAPGSSSLGATVTIGATTDNLRFNGLGLGVAAPTSGGQIAQTLGANNITGLLIKRNTDSAPTGNYFDFQNAAGTTVAKLDVAGALTVTSCTGCGGSGGITVGATTVTSGTATRLFYETAGNLVGEISGATSDGTNLTTTSGVLRATSPRITTSIFDANGLAIITLNPTASAVNSLQITNGATGSPGIIDLAAVGSDSNVRLSLTPKGTAGVVITDASANGLVVGPNGTTGASFTVATNTASAASGITVTGQADGTAPTITVNSRTQQTSSIAGNGLAIAADPAIAGSSSAGAAAGGSITFTAGAAARLTSGNANAGDYIFTSSSGIGTGTSSKLIVPNGTSSQPSLVFTGSTTTGIYQAGSGQIGFVANSNEKLRINSLGIDVGSNSIVGGSGFGSGDAIFRRTAAGTWTFGGAAAASPTAQTLSVQDGTGTNISGASWTLRGSLGTSQGIPGVIDLQTGALISASGTTQQTGVSRTVLGASKVLANNTTTTVVNVTDASNTAAAGFVDYAVEVFDGTDLQVETGSFTYQVTNKGGTIANNTITFAGASGVGVTSNYPKNTTTSGTLAVTWTITAANPALLQVNANSSLTPSTGYPRVTYTIRNLTQQAIAVQ